MVRQIINTDYPLLCSWWGARQSYYIPQEFLPEESYLVHYGRKPVLAMFILIPKGNITRVGWIMGIVSNPDYKAVGKELRHRAWAELDKFLDDMSTNWGVDTLFTFSSSIGLTKKLESLDFVCHEPHMQGLFKNIGLNV